jgi:hypothetical protein
MRPARRSTAQKPRELPGQAAAARSLHQQHATGPRHQRLAAGDHRQSGTQVLVLHPRSASQLDLIESRQPRSNPAEQALLRIYGPRVAPKINLGESPRLVRTDQSMNRRPFVRTSASHRSLMPSVPPRAVGPSATTPTRTGRGRCGFGAACFLAEADREADSQRCRARSGWRP